MDDDQPFCSNCGYRLTGLVDSSKCPECGRPLVEILTRKSFNRPRGFRYTSKAMLFGLPVLDIAFTNRRGDRMRVAKGIIAVGNVACGGIAIGVVAVGVVPIGIVATGLFSIGMVAIAIFCAMGDVALGSLAAGNVVVGLLASGFIAVGCAAQGRVATGEFVRTFSLKPASHGTPRVFEIFSWYFGRTFGGESIIQSLLVVMLFTLPVATFIGIAAYRAWLKNPGKRDA
jgi:hypothetical protein